MSGNDKPKPSRGVRRIPQESILYTRIVPLALVAMGVLLVLILLLSAAIFLGLITW